MSRSYRKHPVCKDKNKGMKQIANRRIRRKKCDISSGKSYRKHFCSYDICDFIFYENFEDFVRSYRKHHHDNKSQKELYRMWYKFYKMK